MAICWSLTPATDACSDSRRPFEQTRTGGERRRANLVLGQRNFNEKFTDASRFNMGAPYGVAMTVERHLVVSDAAHNRVLFFRRPAGGDFTNGMAAERVLGQPDFTSTARVTAGNRMFGPRHIASTPTIGCMSPMRATTGF